MTDNKLLKRISLNPRYLGLLLEGYITDGFFLVKNKEKAEQLIELYISKEYKDLKKNDKKNELMSYEEYFKKRYDSLIKLYSKWKQTISYFEDLFQQYTNYTNDNIEIKEYKITKNDEGEYIVLKIRENEYYILDKNLYDIVKYIYKTPLNFLSKPYSSNSNNITPIALTNAINGEILGFIFPIIERLTDKDYNNL